MKQQSGTGGMAVAIRSIRHRLKNKIGMLQNQTKTEKLATEYRVIGSLKLSPVDDVERK